MLSLLLACALLGALVGVLAGLLGIGGGVLVVPVLLYMLPHYLDIDPELVMPMAIATSLSTILLTASSSALVHIRVGNISRPVLVWSATGIAIGALLGSTLASHIPGAVLKTTFGVLILLISMQMAFYSQRRSNLPATPVKLGIVGGITGTLSAIMGIGGGAMLVPALVWFQVPMTSAIATAAVGGLVIAIFGSLGYIVHGLTVSGLPPGSLGYIYWPATLGIACTSMITARFGARLAYRVPTRKLKKFFAVFLLVVGMRMILG